jgi:hypothetical protein
VQTVCEQHTTQTLLIQINQTVSKEEMKAILRALSVGKALDLDDILNKVLKILVLKILKGLAHMISKLLIGDMMLIRFWELMTLALHKEGKKDYSLLSSYRLIVLKNILIKVMKKVLANRLSLAMKEHDLLL